MFTRDRRRRQISRLVVLSASIGLVCLACLLVAPDDLRVLAQNRMNFSLVVAGQRPHRAGLALRKLNVSGTFMQAAAHPDDET